MKKLFFVLAAMMFFVSCDPPRDLYDSGNPIAIKAQVVDPKTTIKLGDSVAFYFEVPDTVELNNLKIKVSIENNDGATIGFDACKIIPSITSGFSNAPTKRACTVFAQPGSLTRNETLDFENKYGKLFAKFYIIPQEKGVYFFWQREQGYIDLNNQTLKTRFAFNFGNINRNHQMLIDSAGSKSNFSLFLQGQKDMGLEVYGFKVE